jgi:hypothetical protein
MEQEATSADQKPIFPPTMTSGKNDSKNGKKLIN